MRRSILPCLILAGGLSVSVPALADGDPSRGKRVFNKCKACHVVNKAKNRVGPHLVGLFGRKSGSVDGFSYSNAMKRAGIIWREESLDGFLENPRKYVKGTRMSFAGLKKEQDRRDLIAYLRQKTTDK